MSRQTTAIAIVCFLVLTTSASAQIKVSDVVLKLIDQVDVPAQETGLLAEVGVSEGDSVESGGVIARFDVRDIELLRSQTAIQVKIAEAEAANRSAIRDAEGSLAVAVAERDRAATSRQKLDGSVSDAEFERLQLAVIKAESLLEKAQTENKIAELTADHKQKDLEYTELQLDRRSVRSPLNGKVVRVYRRPGEWLEAGDKLARVIRLDALRAEGFINVKDLKQDLLGTKVTLTLKLPGRESEVYSGRIGFVSPEIDTFNQEVRVWAEIENRHGRLQPGAEANMTIMVGR